MEDNHYEDPERSELLALARLAGVRVDEALLSAVLPQLQRFEAAAARARRLDLTDTPPACVFRP